MYSLTQVPGGTIYPTVYCINRGGNAGLKGVARK